jgi:hypothetical protein
MLGRRPLSGFCERLARCLVHWHEGAPLIRPALRRVLQMDQSTVEVDTVPCEIEEGAHARAGRYRQRHEKADVRKLASLKEPLGLCAGESLVVRPT